MLLIWFNFGWRFCCNNSTCSQQLGIPWIQHYWKQYQSKMLPDLWPSWIVVFTELAQWPWRNGNSLTPVWSPNSTGMPWLFWPSANWGCLRFPRNQTIQIYCFSNLMIMFWTTCMRAQLSPICCCHSRLRRKWPRERRCQCSKICPVGAWLVRLGDQKYVWPLEGTSSMKGNHHADSDGDLWIPLTCWT